MATVVGTSIAESASATSLACTVPSGTAAGDLLIAAVIGPNQTPGTTPPSGWTLLSSRTGFDSAANSGIAVFHKIATGSEGSVTFTSGTTANRMTVEMVRITGFDSANPFDAAPVTGVAGAAASYTEPSITTTTADALALHILSLNTSGSSDFTTPSGLTKEISTTGTGRRGAIFSEPRPTAGATDTKAWTLTGTSVQWASIATAIKSGGGVAPPTTPSLLQRVVGVPGTTVGRVAVRTSDATSVRLKVGTDAAVSTGVIFGTAATPDTNGYAQLTVSGLSSGTKYYYRVEMTDTVSGKSLDTGAVGSFKTAPSGQANFAFCFSSCTNGSDSASMAAIAARGDDLFLHLGDLFYADASGTGLANIRAKMQGKITVANHAAVFSKIPTVYTPSDHDGMNNNSTAGSDATAWANWNSAYRENFCAPSLPGATGVYHTFTWGRVRFIVIDTRSFASTPSAADNSSKTRLGATQKQWLKDQITAATEPLIVIVNADPWVGAAVTGDDAWLGAITERTELANFFAASGKNIALTSGDMHGLAADNGTNSPGGVAIFHGSPLNNNASQKGGPYTVGPYPSSGSTVVQQYARIAVTDTGDTISLAYTGYSSDNTQRLTLTKTYSTASAKWTLDPGQEAYSSNGFYRVLMQSDNNLVIYNPGSSPVWASNTSGAGSGLAHAEVSADGTFCVKDAAGAVLWSAPGTTGAGGTSAAMENNGQLVVRRDDGSAVWSSGVGGIRVGALQPALAVGGAPVIAAYVGAVQVYP